MTILILSILLVAAVVNDAYSHKIPNMLTGPGLLAGLVLSVAAPFDSIGLSQALVGVGLGFLILLPGYALGKMGGGDVKLMAMCGSFLGPHSIIDAGVLTLIAGGVLAGLWLLTQKMVQSGESEPLLDAGNRNTSGAAGTPDFEGGRSKVSSIWKQRFPYALAIAIGCYAVMFTQFTLFTD